MRIFLAVCVATIACLCNSLVALAADDRNATSSDWVSVLSDSNASPAQLPPNRALTEAPISTSPKDANCVTDKLVQAGTCNRVGGTVSAPVCGGTCGTCDMTYDDKGRAVCRCL